jgi:hypothetical protein
LNNIKILENDVLQHLPHPDRRYFCRWQSNNRVLFQLEGSPIVLEGLTTNLTSRGACLVTNGYYMVTGQKVTLTIFLSATIIIGLRGRVVWSDISHEKKQAGIAFFNTSMKTEDKIWQYASEIQQIIHKTFV